MPTTDPVGAKRPIMKDFWERKAAENPYYYVSSFQKFDNPNPDEFFAVGRELALAHLRQTPYWPKGAETMLEIGCGIGRMTKTFADLFGEVHAIDISAEMIEKARTHLGERPNVHLHVSNGVDLKLFEDRKFDFVYCYLVFQHFPVRAVAFQYIREVARLLKFGGIFRFQLNTRPPKSAFIDLAIRAKSQIHDRAVSLLRLKAPTELDSPAWRGESVPPHELIQVIHASGMVVRKLEGQGTIRTWVTCVRS